ncbi:nitroreductase [candidate division KSB1 bacterium]|nr:nitroreductase [candidate division KSB1 bacterium]
MSMDIEALFTLFRSRRSIRRFKEYGVDRDIIKECIDWARMAPSAENSQPWRFIVLDDPELRLKTGEKAFPHVFRASRWALKAPVLIVLCAHLDFIANRMGKLFTGIPYYLIDIGIAGEHFALAAHGHGLGSCWIGWFSPKGVKQALDLPRTLRPVALFAVGYPAQDLGPVKNRNPLNDICQFNKEP